MCIRDRASPADFAAFSALEGVPAAFLSLTVTFRAGEEVLSVLPVDYGGSLAEEDIPALPVRSGVYGAWPDFDRNGLTRSLVVEADYAEPVTTLASEGTRPAVLAEGRFAPDAPLAVADWTPGAGEIPRGWSLAGGYEITVEGAEGDLTLRLLAGEGRGNCQVWVLRDGALVRADAVRDGSYLVFTASNGARVALFRQSAAGLPLALLLAVACAAVLLLAAAARHRRKRKEKTPPPAVPSA